ncbi:MAG: hypothetical protein Q4F84_11020, partial [Fibrobacter sp.]|nr:hypothetical protein [Fibrobacter sp.]
MNLKAEIKNKIINMTETAQPKTLTDTKTKIKNSEYSVEPIKLYYTLNSRHARVTIRPDKVDKLIKEKTAVLLRDYIDHNGNILCIKN